MVALLGWTDGFGNDTYVHGIYPSMDEAKAHAKEGLRWVQFDYGEVDFDWYEANEFKDKNKKKKGRNKQLRIVRQF